MVHKFQLENSDVLQKISDTKCSNTAWECIRRYVPELSRSVFFFNKIMLTFQQEDLSSGKFMLKKSKISEKNLRERGFLVPKLKGFAT